MNQKLNTNLYFKDSRSDKVYHIEISEAPLGWQVIAQYGRRGSTLATTVKCSNTPYEKALKLYNATITEKIAKGYCYGEPGAQYTKTQSPNERLTTYQPQLLNEIDADSIDVLINHDWWLAQQKEDGKRVGVFIKDGVVTAANRKGLQIEIPQVISDCLANIKNNCILDGEMVGDTYRLFDCLQFSGRDIKNRSYQDRWNYLIQLLKDVDLDIVNVTDTAFTTAYKRELFVKLMKNHAEGIVFKRKQAPYEAGRPNSGGAQLKCKFWATCSCFVTKINDKRSVAIGLLDYDRQVDVGNVSIPVNHTVPNVGEVIEVRYLYAYPGGSLFQPVYQGTRSNEIDPDECIISQLKYKNEDA